MLKHLIAGIAAVSLTLATPAQAGGLDRDDVGKLILGIAAIAALNAALEHRDREKERSTPAHDRRDRAPVINNNRGNSWSNLSRNVTRRTIPSACLRSVETRFGTQRMFGRRCLEQNYSFVNSLPARCAVRVYTTNGPRRGFDPLCLREQGYRTDRRH